jgi:hypothetical protein
MADLSVLSFIQERLAEADSTLQTRKGTAFYDLFIKPQEFMLQPFYTAMETLLTAQSVNNILALSQPDQFSTSLVNGLVSNVFVTRNPGAYATTTVQVLYATPIALEYAAFTAEFDSNSLSFFNSSDIVLTAAQMALQTQGNFYYANFPVQAQLQGDAYNLDTSQGVTFVNDSNAISAVFLSNAEGGLPVETNTQVLTRASNSIGVRDLETIKGINAIIQENFTYVSEIQAIGMGDPEMQRDILFNAHVGGNTDIYLKTPQFQTQTTNFLGVEFDTTRNLPYNTYLQMTATSFSDPASDLNTPNIVTETVTVTSNAIPTSAFFVTAAVPPITGINLSAGQWIKLQVDANAAVNIKIAGANPSQTQRFEIINSINATVGLVVASEYGTNQILVESPSVGASSQLILTLPDGARSDGTLILIPSAGTSPPATIPYAFPSYTGEFLGVAPVVYIENVDYQINYPNGQVIRLPGSAILSGEQIAQHPGAPDSGAGIVSTGSNIFSTTTSGAFSLVQPGDTVTITSASHVALNVYVVKSKTNNQTLVLLGLNPSAGESDIQYFITSEQVVVMNYQYNPVSIDIGPNVLLSDGVSRGIRPGRQNFTITDVAFIDIVSIQEIDPVTQQGLGIFLNPPGGFGSGGFGSGGFGVGGAGDYNFVVNVPTARFSAWEDSLITFNPSFFGQSFAITYTTATEIAAIHAFCTNDQERVTGASVLAKTFIPALVDMTVNVRPNPTSTTTPTNASLVSTISNYVNTVTTNPGPNPVQQSVIEQTIVNAGLASVQTPFTMTATVLNPDGSTSIITSQDELAVPAVTLPSQTNNFTTPRITHWYPRNIVVTGI